jgi:hypothetical protein
MAHSWFYQHAGKTHGPVSTEEIKRLARDGLIDARDLVWAEDAIPATAIPASAALDLSGLVLLPGTIPDWLADVAAMERKGPVAPPSAADGIPEWLEDLRLWYGLELFVAAKRTGTPQKTKVARTASTPTQIGPIPDWLKTWMTPKKAAAPTKKRPAAKPSQLAPAADAAPAPPPPAFPPGDAANKPTIPVAAPVHVDTSSMKAPPSGLPAPSLPPSPPALAVPAPEPESKIVPAPASEPRPTSAKSAEADAQQLMTPKKAASPTKMRPAPKPSQLAPAADAAPAPSPPAVPPGDAANKPTIPVAAPRHADTSSKKTPPLASPASCLPPSPPALAGPAPEPENKVVPAPANELRPTNAKSAEAEAQQLPPAEPLESPPPVPSSTVPAASEVTSTAGDPVDLLATKALEETGLDLLTGQILDPDKFQTWKQQNARPAAQGQATEAAVSPFEIFRKGRIAVERWVDDDNNRTWIMSAAGDEVKINPEVQALLREHADVGTEIHDKLLHHMEFIVENRRQYYLAMGDKSV